MQTPGRFLLVLLLVVVASSARAEEVGFLSSHPQASEYGATLALALRGYGISLRIRPFEEGDTPLGRAGAAQRVLRELGVNAVLWVEPEAPLRVRALPSTSDQLLEAPLPTPIDQLDANVFASVASSVALEALQRTPQAPAPTPVAALRPVAPERQATGNQPEDPPRKRENLPRPIFLRVALTPGLAFLKSGQALSRNPSAGLLDDGLTRAETERSLAAHGHDCNVKSLDAGVLAVGNCKSLLASNGWGLAPAVDLALGVHATPLFSLALTGRVWSRTAGTLLGLQGEFLLTRPREQGGWIALMAGAGVGRIQVRVPPAVGATNSPRITSGIGNLRTGLLAGYRFHPHVGLTLGLALQAMFPRRLVVFEPSLGLEVRL
jgi:hypothetical protein